MNVLVVGSGIAGPALALLLHRFGVSVVVVERAPSLRATGYAVDIRGAALDVIARMGLRDALRPFETDTLSNAYVDMHGRRFARTERGFGVIDEGDVEIHRGDLARVLYESGREKVPYRFGEAVVALTRTADRVRATFEHGAELAFDLVVGADGVHSRTRALAFGPEPSFIAPLGGAMAVFTVPNHLGLVREQLMFNGPGRVASVKSADADASLKANLFFSMDAAIFDHGNVERQRQLVDDAFRGQGWEFPRLLDAMWAAEDFYADVTCQVHMGRYYDGHVALVGDAAYCPSPLSGQGTSLALVGAYVLAAELLKRPRDIPRALEKYDATMRPFVMANHAVAARISRHFAPQSAFAVWSQNAAMRALPSLVGMITRKAMREISETARGIALPSLEVIGS
jgi:2-polyprenyl-6-methoxyphenol hydroxylase-like FAD-dependent oxidoreductase